MSAVQIFDHNGELRLDGSLVGGPILFSSVTITSAQLKAIDPADSATWPVVLPALPGRNYYLPFQVVWHYRAGSLAYDLPAIPSLNFGPSKANIWATSFVRTMPFDGAVDWYIGTGEDTAIAGTYSLNFAATDIEGANAAVAFKIDTAIATGNGTLALRLFYAIINGAP